MYRYHRPFHATYDSNDWKIDSSDELSPMDERGISSTTCCGFKEVTTLHIELGAGASLVKVNAGKMTCQKRLGSH